MILIPDDTVARLRASLAQTASKPNQVKRWTLQVIERMLVAERAGRVLLRKRVEGDVWSGSLDEESLWHEAVQQAIAELRKERRIR